VPPDHITVCLCTCRRTDRLAGLLSDLARQERSSRFTHSLSVVDNDPAASAAELIAAFARTSPVPVRAGWEPVPNIARARNRSLEGASGNLVAFIDDDESPATDWLRQLHAALVRDGTAAVLGPVRPRYATPPPAWVLRGGFWERDELPTGTRLPWTRCRTGNVLLRQPVLDVLRPVFDERLSTGGEDVDLFRRLASAGHEFSWCTEAAVTEEVPLHRCTRRYLMRRALLRGRDSLRVAPAPFRATASSAAALPLYTLLLPPALLCGQPTFMRLAIRLGDHAGRLLAAAGLEPVRTRNP
jgi:succinoglycan biosynthesis protein ExoM